MGALQSYAIVVFGIAAHLASLLTYGIAVFTYGIAAHLWHQLYMELEFPAEFTIGIGFARDGC